MGGDTERQRERERVTERGRGREGGKDEREGKWVTREGVRGANLWDT